MNEELGDGREGRGGEGQKEGGEEGVRNRLGYPGQWCLCVCYCLCNSSSLLILPFIGQCSSYPFWVACHSTQDPQELPLAHSSSRHIDSRWIKRIKL